MAKFEKLSRFFGKLVFLGRGDYSNEFRESLEFLGWNLKPEEVIAFSRAAMIIVLALLSFPLWYFFRLNGIIGAAILSFVAGHIITEYPKKKTVEMRIRALGEIPNVIVNLIISLRQNSNLENALSFAGKYSDGPIAKDLKKVMWSHWTGKKQSVNEQLDKIALKWGIWSPGFKRAIYLIRSSLSEKSQERRLKTLDKALDVVLDDVNFQNRKYAEEMRTPTMILFSFGTVLPLVAVSILPILSFIGLLSSSSLYIFVMLTLSLAVVYFYSNSIMARKPAGYSQISVPMENSAKWFWFSVAIAIFIAFPGFLYFAGSLQNDFYSLFITGGITAGLSLFAFKTSHKSSIIRNQIVDMESELSDIAYQLGSRTGENRSPEEAVKWVAGTMEDSRMGALLKTTSELVRKRNFTLEQAFFDKDVGVFHDIKSNKIESVFRTFINSAKRGTKACSEAMFNLSNQLSEIKKTNERINHNLTNSLSMMKLTAVVFAPAICGLIVSMQAVMNTTLSRVSVNFEKYGYNIFVSSNSLIPISVLQVLLGIYLIALSYILIRFVSMIKNSGDAVMFRKDIYSNIPTSFVIFILSLILSRGLV